MEKNFGECTNEALFGMDVCDLSGDLFKIVASDFYLFVAEEIICFQNNKIIENSRALNLLNYEIGIH